MFFLILSVSCALAESDNLSNSADNSKIEVFVRDIGNTSVRDAKIILAINSSEAPYSSETSKKHIYLFTNSSGKSIVQLTPGTYDFFIQARNYQNQSKTITIFNGNPGIVDIILIPETGYDFSIFFLPVYLGFLLYVCWLCGSYEKMKTVFILFLLSVFIPFLFLMSDYTVKAFHFVILFFSIFLTISFLNKWQFLTGIET
jgi:hypothetical protein